MPSSYLVTEEHAIWPILDQRKVSTGQVDQVVCALGGLPRVGKFFAGGLGATRARKARPGGT